MKTSDEFLEELKQSLNELINSSTHWYKTARSTAEEVIEKIEQFQAEQKQANDDNLNI